MLKIVTELQRSLAGKNDQLALLIAIRQNLEAIRDDGQKLDIVPLEQGHHLLEATGQPDGHLGSLLVQEEVVQRGDGVE